MDLMNACVSAAKSTSAAVWCEVKMSDTLLRVGLSSVDERGSSRTLIFDGERVFEAADLRQRYKPLTERPTAGADRQPPAFSERVVVCTAQTPQLRIFRYRTLFLFEKCCFFYRLYRFLVTFALSYIKNKELLDIKI